MDLTTNYLGLSLRSPLVPSASPLSEKLDNIRAMEQAGAAAVVFHSLFEEQIEAPAPEFRVDPNAYLENIGQAKNRLLYGDRPIGIAYEVIAIYPITPASPVCLNITAFRRTAGENRGLLQARTAVQDPRKERTPRCEGIARPGAGRRE